METLKADKNTGDPITTDPSAALLERLYDGDFIDAYVLFSLGDDDIAKDYLPYRAKNRDKLETYMDKFVMPPAPAKQ